MSGYVFLIDDQQRVEPVLARALQHTILTIVPFTSTAAAKRKLIEEQPKLILCAAAFAADPDGGFRLARELSAHEVLRAVPLLLIIDQLNEDVIRAASAAGAKSIVPWPVSAESLQQRLRPYLDELAAAASASNSDLISTRPTSGDAPSPAEPGKGAAPSTPKLGISTPASGAPVQTPLQGGTEDPLPRKFAFAQHLLANVLHNLKTSALLDVVDYEDVPTVVNEITRAVCLSASDKAGGQMRGTIAQAPAQRAQLVSPPTQRLAARSSETASSTKLQDGKPQGETVHLDLESVFGMKK